MTLLGESVASEDYNGGRGAQTTPKVSISCCLNVFI